jgi:uncharacterized protein (DUF433 family)
MFATIKLEDYFEFHSADDIRLKGHRVNIEDVLNYYLEGYTPEEINVNLPTLDLEKIHATITFYLHERSQIELYLKRVEKRQENNYQGFVANPPAIAQQVKAEKVKRNAAKIVK